MAVRCQWEVGTPSAVAERGHGVANAGMAAAVIGMAAIGVGVIGVEIGGIITITIPVITSSFTGAFLISGIGLSGAGDIHTATGMAMDIHTAMVMATRMVMVVMVTIMAIPLTETAMAMGDKGTATGDDPLSCRCSGGWLALDTTVGQSMESWALKRDTQFAPMSAIMGRRPMAQLISGSGAVIA